MKLVAPRSCHLAHGFYDCHRWELDAIESGVRTRLERTQRGQTLLARIGLLYDLVLFGHLVFVNGQSTGLVSFRSEHNGSFGTLIIIKFYKQNNVQESFAI